MPKNYAHLRYTIIDACLSERRKRYWAIDEIIEKLKARDIKAGRRTIETDIENMRHDRRLAFHAPIEYCRKNKGHYYTDPDYSIKGFRLTDEEVRGFSLLVDGLQKYKGAQVVKQVEGLFEKLGTVATGLRNRDVVSLIDFEKVHYYKGMAHFDTIINALHNQQPLRITYKKYEVDECNDHVLHPYRLKESDHRWYVIGYSELRKRVIQLALDRVEAIAEAKVPYRTNSMLDLDHFFAHALGVTVSGKKVEEIELWFSPHQGNYIKTLHLHDTQKIVRDDANGLVITLQLIINPELTQTILKFIPNVRVLKPKHLRDELGEILSTGLAMNSGLEN
jgi:predicted DNA-binding transcriptional regulator YafY